jgi:tetratricopeptide (TPR) repeat protein
VAIVAVAIVPERSFGDPGRRIVVAVPPFRADRGSSGEGGLGECLAEAMARGLGALRRVKVVEPGPLSRAIERHGMTWGDATGDALLAAAKSLSTNMLVGGRFRTEGASVHIQIKVIDLAGGRETATIEEPIVALDNLFLAQARLALSVAGRLGIGVSGAEQARLAAALAKPTDSLVAYAYYARGRRYRTLETKEAYPRAVEQLIRAIGLDSNFALAHHELGLVLMAMNNRWRAAGEFRKAIQLDSKLPEAYKHLGDLFLTSPGRLHGQALEAYRKALGLFPDYVDAHVGIAEALRAQGKHDEAIASYRTALQLQPDEARIHLGLGRIYYNEKGLYREAVAEYRAALQLDPANLEALVNLGELYEEKGLYRDAVDSYQRALGIDPTHPMAAYGLALALEKLDRERAIAAWESYLRNASAQASERDWLDIARQHLRKLRGESSERKGE